MYSRTEKQNSKTAGFTLVEMFVAVSILAVTIAVLLTVAQRSLTATFYTTDQVTALFLAQEAVEFVKSVRDGDLSSGTTSHFPWLVTQCGSACTVDAASFASISSLVAPCSGTCPFIFYDDVSRLYGYGAGYSTPTTYRRAVSMSLVAPDEYELTVVMTWQSKEVSRNLTLRRTIYDLASAKAKTEAALSATYTP